MNKLRLLTYHSLLLISILLSYPLHLKAIDREDHYVSPEELHEMLENGDGKYVYLGKEFSDLYEVVSRIHTLENNEDSILGELQQHIEEGFSVGLQGAVVEALEYAEKVLDNNSTKMNSQEMQDVARSLEIVINQVVNDSLNINVKKITTAPMKAPAHKHPVHYPKTGSHKGRKFFKTHHCCSSGDKVEFTTEVDIHGKLKVYCPAQFKKDVRFEDDVCFEDDVRFKDKAIFEHFTKFEGYTKFKEDVTIEETLTVSDLVVLSCIDNLCVANLTVIDIIIPGSCLEHLCVNSLTVSDLVTDDLSANNAIINNLTVTNCITNLCVDNLSVTELAVASCLDSLCVTNLTVTELVVTGLTVIGCLADLCVDDLSVTNAAISGTLSVNNEVVNNLIVNNCMTTLCVNDLSVVNESVSGTLSVNNAVITNLSVTGCLANLCVDSLSAIDESVSGTLSVADLVVINCMSELCVIDLSAVDVSISGTLSVSEIVTASLSTCDVIVGCDILMHNTSGPAIGNIIKDGNYFMNNAGTDNTFLGINAGNFTITGAENVGIGRQALFSNTSGFENVAVGGFALPSNTIGENDIAIGAFALSSNTTGNENTAVGGFSLTTNTTGSGNTAVGYQSGFSLATGNNNVFVGNNAGLVLADGFTNVIIGYNSGLSLTTGSDNIYIANAGVASENGIIRIGTVATHSEAFIQGIFGTVVGGTGLEVFVDASGQLGTVVSSHRFKHNIEGMTSDISENIYKLRPVTFIYNSDETDTRQYGLIAEEVDQVLPALVVHDEEGSPYTVRYHLLPMLLLNEVQKLNSIVQDQTKTIATLKSDNKKFGEIIDTVLVRINRLNLP
jgi:hypothetical protein